MRQLLTILFLICLGTTAQAQFSPSAANTSLSNLNISPSSNGNYNIMYPVTANTKVKPVAALIGTTSNSITGSTSTYTVTYAQNATITTHDVAGSAAVTVTLPTATTLGNANFIWQYCNHSAQADSIVPTTWTIQAGTAAGTTSLSVPSGVCFRISVDANSSTQWHADGNSGGAGAAITSNVVPQGNGLGIVASNPTINNNGNVSNGITYSGTTITIGAILSQCTAPSSGFGFCGVEGPAPTGVGSGKDGLWFDSTAKGARVIENGTDAMSLTKTYAINITPVTVNANSTSDQNLMSLSIGAGTLNKVGKTLRIRTAMVYSTAAASTAQLTFKVKLCTVSGCGSGTVITLISIQTAALGAVTASNDPLQVSMDSTTQTGGASAVFESHGSLDIGITALATAATSHYLDTNTAVSSTIDSTGALFLQVTGAFSAGSTSNSITERQLTLEALN